MNTHAPLKPAATASLRPAALLAAACLAATASAQTDLGPAAGSQAEAVSLILRIPDTAGLQAFVNGTVSAGSPQFRRFLTVGQFAARFAPGPQEVRSVIGSLEAAGIHVTDIASNGLVLRATGTVDALNRYFGVSIHQFQTTGRRYHAPLNRPRLPPAIAGSVLVVVGLSNQPIYVSRVRRVAVEPGATAPTAPRLTGVASGVPGSFTVGDVARLYQVTPLYAIGVKGAGRTIGIATLATFDPADAYGYWSAIGLGVKPNRIAEVPVDGGAGSAGSEETTLDVEQSGGLAPRANIIVYEAPNTDQGFLDMFVKAVTDNTVDSLSVSWGAPEIATDPNLMLGEDEIFMEAAAQGISLFAAAGDAGAYDINDQNFPFTFPAFTRTLTVDSPASSPYITAAGGLTLAGVQQHKFGTVTVPRDRAWGWDYLQPYFDTNYPQLGGYFALAFPVGGGGGVSVIESAPRYQRHMPGVRKSAPNQSLIFFPNYPSTSGAQDLLDLPPRFPGRNLPDVALDADPYTGYLLFVGGAMSAGWGGTSFTAPQLNGIAALLGDVAQERLGFLNPTLYRMARHVNPGSPLAPFTAITSGDNLFYKAARNYNPATGLGSINAANVALRIAVGEIDDD